MDRLAAFLMVSLPDLPFAAIYVVGAALCVGRWRRCPRQSRLALTAFLLFLVRLLVSLALRGSFLFRSSAQGAGDVATTALYSGVTGIVTYGVCLGIVSALFVYFFALGELVSLAISVPLGLLALFLVAWLLG